MQFIFQIILRTLMKAHETVRPRNMHETTIAEFNKVSIKENHKHFNVNSPFRIVLPEFFNIPCFEDQPIMARKEAKHSRPVLKENIGLKKRVKDLTILAEGMKRAKNVKQESRFYFTLGVLLHNNEEFDKSIEYFEKFLRIVIVMGDQKSVQLGLNAIGCEYMYLGEFEKAKEFHLKQAQASHSPDKFISYANIGFCEELQEHPQEAYSKYQMLRGELEKMHIETPQLEQREKIFDKLVRRAEKKVLEGEVFMTEKIDMSPGKSHAFKNSFIKEESSILMKKMSGNRQEYQSAKLAFAISAAEQNIDEYLKSTFNNNNT